MKDFFVPGNEQILRSSARKLGIEPVFLYSPSQKKGDGGVLLDTVNVNTILNAKAEQIVVKYQENIREILERCRRIHLYGMEWGSRDDFIHFRNSGMNHVLAALAAKNNISFLFNFREFLVSNEKSILTGRLRQNLRLYRKYKLSFQVASFASNPYEIKKDFSSFLKIVESG